MPEASGNGLLSEILAFAIILYHLLELRNFHVYMIKNKIADAYA